MLENFLRGSAAIERLRGGLFGPHLDSFVATLSQLGYASETVQKRLRLLSLRSVARTAKPGSRRFARGCRQQLP